MVGRGMTGETPNDDKNLPLSALLPQQPEVNIAKEELLLLSYTAKDREEHQIRFVEIHKVNIKLKICCKKFTKLIFIVITCYISDKYYLLKYEVFHIYPLMKIYL